MKFHRRLALCVLVALGANLAGCQGKQANFLLPTTQYCLPPSGGTIVCFSTNDQLPSGRGAHAWGPVYYIQAAQTPPGPGHVLQSARFELVGPNAVVCDYDHPTGSGNHSRCNLNSKDAHNVLFSYQIEGEESPPASTLTGTAGPSDPNHTAGPQLPWTKTTDGVNEVGAVIVLVYK
jgi:hypothetical protein